MMRRPFIVLLLLWSMGASAQTIQFGADVTQADGQATPTLSWDTTPLADSCVASGDWVGEKGGAGTELLPTITSSATYNLTCTWSFGAATLSWTPPTQNTDGSPLVDLAGYNLYYGQQSGNYPQSVNIANAGVSSFVIENLSPATWYFVGTAYNTNGVESVFSNEAQKVIEATSVVDSIGITINPQPNQMTDLTAQ